MFTLKNQGFEANLLLSTLSPDSDSQSDVTVVSRKQVQSVRKKSSSRSTVKRDNKSSNRAKKPITSTRLAANNTFKNRQVEERNQLDKTHDGAVGNVSTANNVSAEAEASSSMNGARERNRSEQVEQSRLFAISPAASTTSSTTHRKIPENQRKLVSSIFSSITKRKSTSDEDRKDVAAEDLDESVRSPSRQVAKRARLVFQKCLQSTFDSRMLAGHDVILVDDSNDESSSD